MNLAEAKACWQSDGPPGTELPLDQALALVRKRAAGFNRTIRWRDAREIIAAAIVAAFFVPSLLHPSWSVRLAAVLVLVALAGVVIRLTLARRRHGRVGPDRTVREVIRNELERLDEQIRLLETVLWWYIAPLALGVVASVAARAGASWVTFSYAALVGVLAWAVWLLNQMAVRKELRPRREELVRMLGRLEDPAEEAQP